MSGTHVDVELMEFGLVQSFFAEVGADDSDVTRTMVNYVLPRALAGWPVNWEHADGLFWGLAGCVFDNGGPDREEETAAALTRKAREVYEAVRAAEEPARRALLDHYPEITYPDPDDWPERFQRRVEAVDPHGVRDAADAAYFRSLPRLRNEIARRGASLELVFGLSHRDPDFTVEAFADAMRELGAGWAEQPAGGAA